MFLEMFFQDQSFRGPLCVQMKEDKDGVPKLIEINPRFGWWFNIHNNSRY